MRIAIWAIVLVAAFATTTPKPWLLTALGMGLGCISAYLGTRATRSGSLLRAPRALAWASGIGLLVLAAAFAVDMFVGAWVASFAGYLLMAVAFSRPAGVAANTGAP